MAKQLSYLLIFPLVFVCPVFFIMLCFSFLIFIRSSAFAAFELLCRFKQPI